LTTNCSRQRRRPAARYLKRNRPIIWWLRLPPFGLATSPYRRFKRLLQDLPLCETAAGSCRQLKWQFELILIKFETVIYFRKFFEKIYKKSEFPAKYTTRAKCCLSRPFITNTIFTRPIYIPVLKKITCSFDPSHN
jgi:hypothetical protein